MASWESIFVICWLMVSLAIMAFEIFPVDFTMLGTVFTFVVLGIIDVKSATEGFANEGMLTVMVLFATSAAVASTGCLEPVRWLLTYSPKGQKPSTSLVLYKLFIPIGALSAFLNNTPIVAMFIPVLQETAAKLKISPSKLMLPLSYAAIFGGTCTLIGTSTNLVAFSLAKKMRPDEINNETFGLFALGVVGMPAFLAGALYVAHVGPTRLLPNRIAVNDTILNPREFLFLAKVGSSIAGKTIAAAKLRKLRDIFLVQIDRDGHVIPAPAPDTILGEGDILYFGGRVDAMDILRNIKGITIIPDEEQEIDLRRIKHENTIFEVIIANKSPLVGEKVADLKFRTKYNAAIIAVHRDGERLHQALGQTILEAGDVLLLIAPDTFLTSNLPDHKTFSMIRQMKKIPPPRSYITAGLTASFLISAIVVSTVANISLLVCAIVATAAMLLIKAVTPEEARNSLSWEVLIVVAASFGLGNAMSKSGAANMIADGLIAASKPTGDIGLMICVYVLTVILNAILTNNAAVAVVFPIIDAACTKQGLEFYPYLLILMMAGSADFATPIGYQCNLMVYAPGGYKFMDYFRFGLPLQVITGIVTIGVSASRRYWWLWTLILAIAVAIGIASSLGMSLLTSVLRRRSRADSEETLPPPAVHRKSSDEDKKPAWEIEEITTHK
ncbi:citrate transporter-domain-containing protein [Gaertneriomyces semiglobifer]|nr:citrate transporter-domain-containing protein [Gaertneriomyces semiglobifer]